MLSRLLLFGCIALPTATAFPQRPPDRSMVAAWEARVDSISAEKELHPLLDSATSKAATKGQWELGFLRRGIVSRRLGQLTQNRRYFDEALEDFWAVAGEHRDWPQAWYGLGSTKLAMARQQLLPYPEEHQPEGSTYEEEGGVALARALEADSTFAPAKRALAGAAGPAESNSPGAVLALARLRREAADLDSTLALLGEYLRIGGDSGIGYLEMARTLFEAGKTTPATRAYYAAVERLGSAEAREALADDLAWLMDSSEVAAFRRLPADSLGRWVQAFWERRDVRDVRHPGERLIEHYRRLAYAERNFARVSKRLRHTPGQRYESHQTRLDDRAVIYIRHGPPDQRASFGSPFASAEAVAPQTVYGEDGLPGPRPDDATAQVPPNLSWKYVRPDGNLIFHFAAGFGDDFKLIESLLDVFSLDSVIALQMSAHPARGSSQLPAFDRARFTQALIQSRAQLDPVYTRLANRTTIQGSTNLQRERATGQHSLAVGTTTDGYRHRFPLTFQPIVQGYGVSRKGTGRVLVVLGVEQEAGEIAGERYPLSLSLVVASGDDRLVAQVDTVVWLRTRSATGGKRHSEGFLELPAPPGQHRLRVMLVDSLHQAGWAGQVDGVALPSPRSSGLVLSDLILGAPDGLVWPGPDGPVSLNSSGVFDRRAPVALYYSISGLVAASTYRTTIEIGPDRPGSTRRIASQFPMVARDVRQAEQRRVTLQGLKSGAYVLTVTVTGPGGSASRNRSFRVK